MCGIVSYIGATREGQWAETYAMLNTLFLECEHRGRDATGFTAVTHPYKEQFSTSTITDKAPIKACDFIRTNEAWRSLKHKRCSTILGHVRYATNGIPSDNENNHPHISDDIHLVHNGVINNYQHVSEMYCLPLSTKCDSEVLLRLLEGHHDLSKGLEQCLRICAGSMAIVVYDWSQDLLYLCRNGGRPLTVMKFKNDQRWWVASTETILLNAKQEVFGDKYEIELLISLGENRVYELSPMTGQLLMV